MAAHGKAHVSLVSTARLLQLMMCIGVHTEEAPVDGGPWTRMLSGYWMCRVCVCVRFGDLGTLSGWWLCKATVHRRLLQPPRVP